MSMDPNTIAGLEAANPLIFHAVELVLDSVSPPETIRLIDTGLADITFSVGTFAAEHPTYGTVSLPEGLQDGIGDESPHLTLLFLPPSDDAAVALAAASAQGSRVRAWFGVIDRDTGQPAGEPDLIHDGWIDVPQLHADKNSRAVEIDCGSVWDLLLEGDEAVGLTNASHQSFFDGERGFEFVTEVEQTEPWGSKAPRNRAVIQGASDAWYFQGNGLVGGLVGRLVMANL